MLPLAPPASLGAQNRASGSGPETNPKEASGSVPRDPPGPVEEEPENWTVRPFRQTVAREATKPPPDLAGTPQWGLDGTDGTDPWCGQQYSPLAQNSNMEERSGELRKRHSNCPDCVKLRHHVCYVCNACVWYDNHAEEHGIGPGEEAGG